MAKKIVKIEVVDQEDVDKINYSEIGNYDFSKTVDMWRPEIIGRYLEFKYQEAYSEYYKGHRKILSQTDYARGYVHINPMTFSAYKVGKRMPAGENLDTLAQAFGDIMYDMAGVPAKMPRDPEFRQVVDLMKRLTKTERKEYIERLKNFIDNKTEPPPTIRRSAKDDDFDDDNE